MPRQAFENYCNNEQARTVTERILLGSWNGSKQTAIPNGVQNHLLPYNVIEK